MKKFAIGAGLAVVAVSASGCATQATLKDSGALAPVQMTVPELEAYADKLDTASFSFKTKDTVDIDALVAAMPQALAVTYDAVESDASGATVLTNVKFAPSAMPTLGVNVGTLKLWGLDDDFAVARLNGQRLDESGPLARRMEADDISLYGLESVLTPLMAMASAQTEVGLPSSFESYNFTIRKLVYNDVRLRPFVMEAKDLHFEDPDLNEVAQYFPVIQQIAAFNRAIAADSYAMYDLAGDLAMTVEGSAMAGTIAMDRTAARGVRGFDVDVSMGRGFNYDFDMTIHEGEVSIPMQMAASVETFSTTGMRLDKAMGYLARGVMPPRTESDLMSLGVSELQNERVSIGGEEVYSVGSGKVDLTGWRWFVPTKIGYEVDNAVYDIKAFGDFVMNTAGEEMSESEIAEFDAVVAALAKQGLDKPSFDLDFNWTWDADKGDTLMGLGFGVDDFAHTTMSLDGVLPDFQSVSDLIPDDVEATDQEALQALFMSVAAFRSFSASLVDEGGLEKGPAVAIDIAKLAPEDDASAAMLRNATPESLRQMAASLLFIAGASAAEEIPQINDYIAAIAGFLTKGGELSLNVKPAEPLGVEALAALEAAEPRDALDALGVSVVHTPPPEAK